MTSKERQELERDKERARSARLRESLEERKKLEAQKQEARSEENQKRRDESRREAELKRAEARRLIEEKGRLQAEREAIAKEYELSFLEKKHELQPEELDRLFFDATRHAQLQFAAEDRMKAKDLVREEKRIAFKVKWRLILEESLLKIRSKHPNGLSDEQLQKVMQETISEAELEDF